MVEWRQPHVGDRRQALVQRFNEVVVKVRNFRDRHELTDVQLHRLFLPAEGANIQRFVGIDRFKEYLRGDVPIRPETICTAIDMLESGLSRATAKLHQARRSYEWLSTAACGCSETGRCTCAEHVTDGFDLYLGDYNSFRLSPQEELVRGDLRFYWHEEARVPYHRQQCRQDCKGNPREFCYRGFVMMMPRTMEILGMGHDQLRPTKIMRGNPEVYLIGVSLSQLFEHYTPFGSKVVLWRKDVYERDAPTDEYIRKLLVNGTDWKNCIGC